jgi:Tfp pilus assembly pilus retraction ATPase PilT
MITLDQYLQDLVRSRQITIEDARSKAVNKDNFAMGLTKPAAGGGKR